MEVLILGGTGAMGIHLIEYLVAKGIFVTVTSRKDRDSAEYVTYVKGNAHDVNFLTTLLERKRWDVIVDFMVYSTEEFRDRAELLLKSTKQYIFLSSARVYADSKEAITEDSSRLLDVSQDKKFLQTDEYPLSKAREENILFESAYKNWTIIRPYITFSEIRLQLGVFEKEDWLYRALHGRTIVFSNDIAEKYTTLTYAFDVVNAMVQLMGNDKAHGEVFHITSDKAYTWNEILAVYLDVLEEKLSYRPKLLMLEKSITFKFGHPQYSVLYDRYYNRVFDNQKIKRFIEPDAFYDVKTGIRNCLQNFLVHPVFRGISWYLEALNDRVSGCRTPLHEIPSFYHKIGYLLVYAFPGYYKYIVKISRYGKLLFK